TGDNVFRDIEAEATEIAKGTGGLAVVSGFDGVSAILDHLELMLFCQSAKPVHVTGPAGKMNGQNRPGPRSDLPRDLDWIDIHGHGINVCQNGLQTGMDDGIDRGAEGQRRGNDLIARLQPG